MQSSRRRLQNLSEDIDDYSEMNYNPGLDNVQVASVWKQIEANIVKFKKDSQSNYRQILDEQIKHKLMLGK